MIVQVRTLRLIRAALLISAAIYIVIAEKIVKSTAHISTTVYVAMVLIAGAAGIATVVARYRLAPAEVAGEPFNPADKAQIQRWMVSYIIPYAIAESIVLDGFIVRFLGARLSLAAPFYALGIVLMLLFPPQPPD